MALIPPNKESRDANLTALESSVKEWVEKEKKRLEDEVKFMRAIMRGRLGVSKVALRNLSEATSLAQAEIDRFILG